MTVATRRFRQRIAGAGRSRIVNGWRWILFVPCLLLLSGCGTEQQTASEISVESAAPTEPPEDDVHRCGDDLPNVSTAGVETKLLFDSTDQTGTPTGKFFIRNVTNDTIFVRWNGGPDGAVADGIDEQGAKISGPYSLPAIGWFPPAIAPGETKTVPVVAGIHDCDAPGADMGFVRMNPGTYTFAVLMTIGPRQDDLGGFLYSESAEAEVRVGN